MINRPSLDIIYGMVTIEDIKRLGLKVGEIVEVRDHPNADRLYVLRVNLGDEERTLVAGIRAYYRPEELLGKKIVVVTNLQPATIRGVKSEGMLLAGDGGGTVSLLTVDKDVPPGSEVR